MGFDKIVAWMGVAVILIITLSAFFLVYNSTILDIHDFYRTDRQMLGLYKTDFTIEDISYNKSGIVKVNAKNTGDENIELLNAKKNECIDVFIDGNWIYHENIVTGITNNAYDPLTWNPMEYLNIIVNQSLSEGIHTLTVVECRGLKETAQFMVERSRMIYFVPPTEDNWATISKNWTYINITINADHPSYFGFNWNGTNTTVYNDSFLLAYNFNNVSALGENYNNSNGTRIVDISGHGYDGILHVGADCSGNYSDGKYNGGYVYDGIDDYIDMSAYTPAFRTLSTGTVMAWFRDRPKNNQTFYCICNSTNAGNTANMCLGDCTTVYSDESITIEVTAGGLDCIMASVRKGSMYYMDNTWHQFAFVVGTDYNRLYIDGEEQALSYNTGSPKTGNCFMNVADGNVFTLAGRILNGYDSMYFNGSIDEFRVYSRPLSSNEVMLLYQSEFAGYSAGEWHFYANVTNLTDGVYSYYGRVNDSTGKSDQTDGGNPRYLRVYTGP